MTCVCYNWLFLSPYLFGASRALMNFHLQMNLVNVSLQLGSFHSRIWALGALESSSLEMHLVQMFLSFP